MSTTLHTDSTNDALLMLGRILASAIFLVAGWSTLMAMASTTTYLTSLGLQLPAINYWVVAVVLALWCLATAAIAHTNFPETAQQLAFMKNLAIAGGFLAFAAWVGAGAYSQDHAMGRRQGAF